MAKPSEANARALSNLFPATKKRKFDVYSAPANSSSAQKKKAFPNKQGRSKSIKVILLHRNNGTIPRGVIREGLKKSGQIKDVPFLRHLSAEEVKLLIQQSFSLDSAFRFLKANKDNSLCLQEKQELTGLDVINLAGHGCLYVEALSASGEPTSTAHSSPPTVHSDSVIKPAMLNATPQPASPQRGIHTSPPQPAVTQPASPQRGIHTSPPQPAVTQPALTQPAITQPAVTQPALTQPAVTQPAVTQPALTQPAVTQPALTQSAVTQPAITQSAVAVCSSPPQPAVHSSPPQPAIHSSPPQHAVHSSPPAASARSELIARADQILAELNVHSCKLEVHIMLAHYLILQAPYVHEGFSIDDYVAFDSDQEVQNVVEVKVGINNYMQHCSV